MLAGGHGLERVCSVCVYAAGVHQASPWKLHPIGCVCVTQGGGCGGKREEGEGKGSRGWHGEWGGGEGVCLWELVMKRVQTGFVLLGALPCSGGGGGGGGGNRALSSR